MFASSREPGPGLTFELTSRAAISAWLNAFNRLYEHDHMHDQDNDDDIDDDG